MRHVSEQEEPIMRPTPGQDVPRFPSAAELWADVVRHKRMVIIILLAAVAIAGVIGWNGYLTDQSVTQYDGIVADRAPRDSLFTVTLRVGQNEFKSFQVFTRRDYDRMQKGARVVLVGKDSYFVHPSDLLNIEEIISVTQPDDLP
jgi:hypothetical protein